MKEILEYMKGRADITDSPHVNTKSLKEKGFSDGDIEAVNKALTGAFEIKFAFNVWTLGEECMKRVGFQAAEYNDPNFNMLKALGYSDEQMEEANEYVCGSMTVEGAPHLKEEHYSVFDTANRNGKKGRRLIHYAGHIKMMAAVQPFLSGAISKTINMPNEVTVDDVKYAYDESWKSGLKAVALYRDGSKLSQPLSTSSENNGDKEEEEETVAVKEEEKTTIQRPLVKEDLEKVSKMLSNDDVDEAVRQASEILSQHTGITVASMESYERDGTVTGKRVYLHGEKRKVPAKRGGITVSTKIGNQQIWMRTGEYPDGRLAEIFIDMYKEGAGFRSLLNMFAICVSMGLQHGVPLEKYVENFVFTRFEPAGFTDHPNIKSCTSVIDFVFRVLGMEYLGRTDFVQVPPKGIQKNKFENLAKLSDNSAAQNTMNLQVKEIEKVVEQVDDDQISLPTLESEENQTPDSMDKALEDMMGDAPACATCGHVTVRNGSCYRCLNCGDSMGCS